MFIWCSDERELLVYTYICICEFEMGYILTTSIHNNYKVMDIIIINTIRKRQKKIISQFVAIDSHLPVLNALSDVEKQYYLT